MFDIFATSIALSLYGVLVLKLHLDIFLHKVSGFRGIVGWLPFFIWQCFSETGCFSGQITLSFTFMTIILVGMTAYEGSCWKRCVFPIVFLTIWMLLEGGIDFAAKYVSGRAKTEFLLISIMSKVLLLLVCLGIKQFAKQKGIGKEPYGGGIFFIIAPIMGMLLYHTLYGMLHRRYDNWSEVGIWMLIATFALIVLNLSFYPIYMQLVRELQVRKSAHFYKKQMELLNQENAMEEAAATEIREFRHDMKQHLIYLGELIRSGEMELANDTLTELLGETSSRGRLESRTGNKIIDSLINHTWRNACKAGIAFHADIGPLPELSIKDADLCVLLGNALDNALEASDFVENGKKEIWVALVYKKGCLLFQLKNRYEGTIKRSADGKIRSRKKENGHGLGLYSMEKIVEKYHGKINVKPCDGVFTIEILIYCESGNEGSKSTSKE